MADPLGTLLNNPIGKQVTQLLGLPQATELRRHEPDGPLVPGPVVVATAPGARAVDEVHKVLADAGVTVIGIEDVADPEAEAQAAEQGGRTKLGGVIVDVTGVTDLAGLGILHDAFHTTVRQLGSCARVIVVGGVPEALTDPSAAAAQQALDGFTRSLAKELRSGSTANLVRVHEGAEAGLASTLRFLLSGRSAYVTGQPITVGPAVDGATTTTTWDTPLAGKVAVVTGSAQGIGAAIAATLARAGAEVVCLDLPSQGDDLAKVANDIGGSTLQLDVTAPDAPAKLAAHLRERHAGVDIVVHNAGVTRDKTIVGMDRKLWDMVIDINLASQERLDAALLEGDDPVLHDGGRIVGVASTSGIAGNRGQTNYAASKAGVIGRVRSLSQVVKDRNITVNGVAPGFIETEMTDRMPFAVREVGRRINSLNQGGQPVDVAETIAWLASPASGMVTGQVVRVCGQSLVGS